MFNVYVGSHAFAISAAHVLREGRARGHARAHQRDDHYPLWSNLMYRLQGWIQDK